MKTRGQATVELALGSLVFVSVLLMGIHFAELGVIKLRTQQAAASALWDTTGRRMHHLAEDATADRFPGLAQLNGAKDPATRAKAQYRDFDATKNGGSTIKLALTQASALDVNCRGAQVAQLTPLPVRLSTTYSYPPNGDGIQCSGSARVELFRVPRHIADQGSGFFQAPEFLRPTIEVCAFGRAQNGVCRGEVPIALDDWGLSGSGAADGDENNDCDQKCLQLRSRGNLAYRMTVKKLYDRYLIDHVLSSFNIDAFVLDLFTKSPAMPSLANVPVDETDLRFDFIGEDGMTPQKPGPYAGEPFDFAARAQDPDTVGNINFGWPSTPYSSRYKASYADRGKCFSGIVCKKSIFEKRAW